MKQSSVAALTVGALGIVYGDIGTSPLYAMNEVFFGSGHLAATPEHIAGVASLIFWMLALIIGIKYATFVLRADHDGEGGVFALLGLIERWKGRHIVSLSFLLMFAAGLLFGDGIITPAISVLSAIEGLNVAAPGLGHFVVPLTIAVLFAVFFFQRFGTKRIGKIYGPIMLLWFVSIGLLGLRQVLLAPEILAFIVNPFTALSLLASLSAPNLAFLIGAVFLVLTGSEALYADLGHFGKRAIRIGWHAVVFPSLVLCYAGQSAYLLRGAPVSGGNLFYSLVPEALLYPMILLATMATVIASVALIFGAYSLISQAIVLHLLPRLRIVHTNRETEGQIYIPAVNLALLVGSVSLVLFFGSASRLAAAYGFSVAGVMFVTSIAMVVVAREEWRWRFSSALAVFGSFAVVDAGFFIANSAKFLEGGYIPFLLGCGIFAVVATWRWGRGILRAAYDAYSSGHDMGWFLDLKRRVEDAGGILKDDRIRQLASLDRAVVFLVSRPIIGRSDAIPVKLRVYLKRKGAIPKDILLLNIDQERIPFMKRHYHVIDLGQGVFSVKVRFGFMENPDAAHVLRELYREDIFEKKFRRCTIEVSEDELILDHDLDWKNRLRGRFFRKLLLLSVPAYRYFGLRREASAGLSKTVTPVRLCARGVRVEIPEFPLDRKGDLIDPDTLLPTTTRYTAIR
jgi:KUP system potassium uptake protein